MIAKILNETKSKALKQINLLEPRTRKLFILLIIISLLCLSFNIIYKPQRREITRLQQDMTSFKNRIMEIQAQIPNIKKEEQLLGKAQKSLEVLQGELSALETELPDQDSLPTILGELVKQSAGYAVDFNSIKPATEKKQSEYQRLNIEMSFSTNFSGLINYLRRVENISQFISTTGIVVEEKKDVVGSGLDVNLKLSTLLGDQMGSLTKINKIRREIDLPPLKLKRNPFMSDMKPRLTGKRKLEFKLSGIISQGEQPTAIINDDVYKVGDWVDNGQIMEISETRVTLQSGSERIVLSLESGE